MTQNHKMKKHIVFFFFFFFLPCLLLPDETANVKDFGGCDQANTKMTLQIITQSERKMK
jgi:hypothetical protein